MMNQVVAMMVWLTPSMSGAELQARPVVVSVMLGETHRIVALIPYNLRHPEFMVYVQTDEGIFQLDDPVPLTTYRGVVIGVDGSRVYASIKGGQLNATIELGPDERHVLDSEPIIVDEDLTAELISHGGYRDSPDLHNIANCISEIAFDTDHELFLSNGSSVTDTIADVEGIFNGVAAIYEEEIGVRYALTAVIVRTTTNDPYTTAIPWELLHEFRDHWILNHSDVPRDNAHLLTGRLPGISDVVGMSSQSSMCNDNLAYGVSFTSFALSHDMRVALTAREIARNWGAKPCCIGCSPTSCPSCELMCNCVGGCGGMGGFSDYTIEDMLDFRETLDCLDSCSTSVLIPGDLGRLRP